ncbi:MAG: TonB-dependent receptor [Bacteroidales bacterium]
MIKYGLALGLIIFGLQAWGQKATIKGKVTDALTGEAMPGVNVIVGKSHGTTTDNEGQYQLKLESGKYRLAYSIIGYNRITKVIEAGPGETLEINVKLEPRLELLNETVISASRYEQRLSDVIVSMDVRDAAQIERTHTLSMEEAVQQVPGVMILDDQASIRGGNGYSYGVGSRVLLMLDELPFLTGASSEAKWNFLPIENISSMEVIKGASSALYGSSALNGVINIRTAYPREKPATSLTLFSGIYGNPARPEIKWWGNRNPSYTGLRLNHSRMAGPLDLTAGITLQTDEGYREKENEQMARISLNTRYRFQKIQGLSVGLNGNYMRSQGGNFLIWLNGTDGIYRPANNFDQRFDNTRFNLDPFMVYLPNPNERHSLRGRIFRVSYQNDTLTHTHDDTYFTEYQYYRNIKENFNLITGVSTQYVTSNSTFFGRQEHSASNQALYVQGEQKLGNLRITLGARYEWYRVNRTTDDSRPLLRAGLNYQLAQATFLRASFGQGYRYPAIAEKYAATQVGALHIFPNPSLKAEKGWNAETGIKQAFYYGALNGFIDVAAFYTRYYDMIEFTFGQHYPDTLQNPSLLDFFKYTGFKAENIANAVISGFEVSFAAMGKRGNLGYRLTGGYTYTNPKDPDFDKIPPEQNTATTQKNILKYRFYHSAKLMADFDWKKLSAGVSFDWHSHMINIDKAFEDSLRFPNGTAYAVIVPGLKEYRQIHNRGDYIINLRLSYDPVENTRFSLIINNLLNREYMTRPADVGPPRVLAVQYIQKF